MASRSLLVLCLVPALASAAGDRIAGRVDPGRAALIHGHIHPDAQPGNDRGAVDPSLELSYVSVLMKPPPGLEAFLAEQRNPASPNYHQWLTPEQFADRFGLSRNDIAKVRQWLESQGLRVHDVARGRHWITFSGTAGQVGRAFRTEIRRYEVNGRLHVANASEPSVPEALADVVAGVEGLNDFGMEPLYTTPGRLDTESPQLNSGNVHYLAPGDFATIFGVKPLYDIGIDGAGQRIAVIGRTEIDLADIRAFRNRFNLPPSEPEMVLVGPSPGTSSSDLPEADLDIEWSGAVAPKATIVYVYSRSINTSVQYAIDQNIAPVMTESYGSCERANTPALRYLAQQANAQGITWLVASGDRGAATCDSATPTPQAAKGATLSFPATIPEVTAVGGTTLNDSGGAYWAASNDSSLSSALSYIPERVWNSSASRNALVAAGGGPSALFSKPYWQAGPGVPDDSARDVPDLSLPADPDHDGYQVYTSGGVHIFGGTSVGTPAFAGVLALLNQYLTTKGVLAKPGLGNINPTLYRLVQTTPEIFHDVTAGDNMVPCAQSSPGCVNGLLGFSAGPNFDLATGLGSIDTYNLVTKWALGTAAHLSLNASPSNLDLNSSVVLTATVSGSGNAAPTGSVTFLVNDTLLGRADLKDSTAVVNTAAVRIAAGNGTITALYSGDSVYDQASASTKVSFLPAPPGSAMVVPSFSPNPAYQQTTASGSVWVVTVTLFERAGVNAKLTGLKIDGEDYSSQITSFFGGANIPANGQLSAALALSQYTPPVDSQFTFSGTDDGGNNWTRQLSVTLVSAAAPGLFSSIRLTATPTAMVQNPQADPACQWSQRITVQEQGGYLVQLTRLTSAANDLSSQIQRLFGTTRLAPYGSLQATLCWSGVTAGASRTLQLTGATETGGSVTSSLGVTFAAPAPAIVPITADRDIVTAVMDRDSRIANTQVRLIPGSNSARWSVAVLPSNGTADWLSVTPISGAGSAQLDLKFSGAGLSPGAYRAVLAIQSADTTPQFLSIPVSLVVGASPRIAIDRVTNAAGFQPSFAPGMLVAVFGPGLAPGTQPATRLPLPLTIQGVSATVNGVTAPLHYISTNQVNLQIPFETGAGPAVLAINNNGEVAATALTIDIAAPGLFGIYTPQGAPADSVARGQVLLAFVSGQGDVNPTLATGAGPAAGTALSRLPQPRLPLTISVGGVQAETQFAGVPTGSAGVVQINFTIPDGTPSGKQPVVVTVGGVPSAPVMVTVQ